MSPIIASRIAYHGLQDGFFAFAAVAMTLEPSRSTSSDECGLADPGTAVRESKRRERVGAEKDRMVCVRERVGVGERG